MKAVLAVVVLSLLAVCGKNGSTVPTATALSPAGSRHTWLSWSPDGKRVTWWTPGSDTLIGFQLWIANADFSSPVKLPVIGFLPVTWSADGKWIAATASDKGIGQVVVVPSEPPAGAVARHVTPGTALQNHVMFHPHGDRLLYVEFAEGGVYTMSVVSLATGKRTALLPNEKRPYSGVWSPDGSHIAYSVQEGAKSTVWVADSSGLNPRQLTTEGFEWLYSFDNTWSPDGKEILYESRRTGTADLWVAPIDGAKPRQITHDVRNDRQGAWSSDGKWIAFLSDRGRQLDIWVVPSAGGAEQRITDGVAEETEMPRWRPGTHQLAFTSTTPASGLWALDLRQGKERRLTPDSIRTSGKEVSPDGQQIAFVIERGGGIADLATMPFSGGAWRTLVAGGGSVTGPTWSPDGSHIAFQSDRGGTNDVWIVDASGGAPRQVENWPGYEQAPTWSGDGSQLYFVSDREAKLGDVWKAPAAGGEPARVTRDGSVYTIFGRVGVPDLFALTVSQRAGELNISRVTTSGRLQPIWDKSNAAPGPISPRGDSVIILVQQPDGMPQAMKFSVTGGGGRPILKRLEWPTFWSRDGTSVLYTFPANGLKDIGLLNLVDGSTRRLTTSPEDETGTPEFTADAKTVVFSRDNSVTRIYTTDLTKLLAGGK